MLNEMVCRYNKLMNALNEVRNASIGEQDRLYDWCENTSMEMEEIVRDLHEQGYDMELDKSTWVLVKNEKAQS